MFRKALLGLVVIVGVGSSVQAQDWARKMFDISNHDFGTVAAGAKTEFEFPLKNLYLEDVHIASVTASCGCTIPYIKKDTLKTYEKGAIVAVFNTSQFQGARGATLTVTIDRPYFAQVQLQVKGFIRRDIVLNPGNLQLGTVDEGEGTAKGIAIRYAGRDDWRILDAKSTNPNISTRVVEVGRGNGYVDYHLFAYLDKNAPPGTINDRIVLATNDYNLRDFPVPVEGMVQSGISVPSSLFLGVVEPGKKVTMPLVIKGKKPFRITAISSDADGLQFDTSNEKEAKVVHVIPVTFTAGKEPGKINGTIQIETDMGAKSPKLSAHAVVAAAGR